MLVLNQDFEEAKSVIKELCRQAKVVRNEIAAAVKDESQKKKATPAVFDKKNHPAYLVEYLFELLCSTNDEAMKALKRLENEQQLAEQYQADCAKLNEDNDTLKLQISFLGEDLKVKELNEDDLMAEVADMKDKIQSLIGLRVWSFLILDLENLTIEAERRDRAISALMVEWVMLQVEMELKRMSDD